VRKENRGGRRREGGGGGGVGEKGREVKRRGDGSRREVSEQGGDRGTGRG